MAATAAQVKELRDKTGAGMMDCKSALDEANGDMDKAIELLRKKGLAQAAEGGQGLVGVADAGVDDFVVHPAGGVAPLLVQLAGALLAAVSASDMIAREDWRQRGAAFFQAGRGRRKTSS